LIRNNLEDGKTILELGSGSVTSELCKYYKVYSIEHDVKYVGKYPGSTYIHAPLIGDWYDPAILKRELTFDYDFLFIDGPPTYARRIHMLEHLDLFKSVPMLADNCKVNHRPDTASIISDYYQLSLEFFKSSDWQGYKHFYALMLPKK